MDARLVCYGCYPAMVQYLKGRRLAGDTRQIILVGHSHGADDALRAAAFLKTAGVRVDLVVTIDPVDPPLVPDNVARAYNIFWSQPVVDVIPVFRGSRVRATPGSHAEVVNLDVRTSRVFFKKQWVDHFNIEDQLGIQNLALEQIFQTMRRRLPLGPATDG